MKVVFLIAFLLVMAHCTPVSNLLMSISANQPWFMHSNLNFNTQSSKKKSIIGVKVTVSILSFFGAKSNSFKVFLKILLEGFPDGPVAKIPSSPGRGPGFDPRSGNQIPHAAAKTHRSQKNK